MTARERRYDTVETNTHHSPTRQEDQYCPVCGVCFPGQTRCPDGCGADLVSREDARAVSGALGGLLGEGETT